MAKEKKQYITYDAALQEFYLQFLMSDSESFARCQSILREDYWMDQYRPIVRCILNYAEEHHLLPTHEYVKAHTNHELSVIPYDKGNSEVILSEIEQFCRHRAIENVLYDGAEKIAEGLYSDVETKLKEAITISLQRDIGMDYFDNPEARINLVKDKSSMIATGWRDLDAKLYGGFTKGGLNIFAGGSGSGKSLFLQNLSLNWFFAGYHVVYITLELAEALVATRMDAMVANVSTKDVFRNTEKVAMTVALKGKESKGSLTLKKMPEAGTTANVIRAYLKEYQVKHGRLPDALLVDYLDLMYPNNPRINPTDQFMKDKYVSEELRALYGEYQMFGATASQLNRGSIDANEYDHSHIAGGLSKINTADNVFGIFTSQPMRERGEYQLQFLKTRSSSAVGQRISLGYNQESLRMIDMDEDEKLTQTRSVQDIKTTISRQTNVSPNQPAPQQEQKPTQESQNDILNKIRAARQNVSNTAKTESASEPDPMRKVTGMQDILKNKGLLPPTFKK
jgi:KaiC/GvpD/RAD55 family RecA-like ATPase